MRHKDPELMKKIRTYIGESICFLMIISTVLKKEVTKSENIFYQ